MNRRQVPLRWILSVLGNTKLRILLLTVLHMLLSAAGLCYAPLFKRLIDAASARDPGALGTAAAGFGAVLAAQLVLRAANRYVEEDCRARAENACKDHLFGMILRKQYAPVAALHTGEWMNRLTSDARIVADNAVYIVPGVSGLLVRLIGALALLLVYEPRFVIVLVPGGLLLVGLTFLFRRKLKSMQRVIREKDGALRVFLQERVEHLMLVRAFGREDGVRAQEQALIGAHRDARVRRARFSALCGTGFSLATGGAYVLSGVWCAYRVFLGQMSYGTLTAILQLVSQVQSPFAGISGYVPRYYAMLTSAERLMEIEELPDESDEAPVPAEEIRALCKDELRAIRLDDIRFSYEPGKCVLEDCSIRFPAGTFTAILGASGCGKSTLLKLLMCFYPLAGGQRLLECEERSIPLTPAWRGLFAYVPQGSQLMSGTIREAVRFERQELSDEQVRRALYVACADGFTEALPEGLDTRLGERGAGLSEGQLQRLAIARAICSGRPVLLLDEATSALDEQTEAEVLRRLRGETGLTVIIVTHRRAALAIVDQIVECRSEDGLWSWHERPAE